MKHRFRASSDLLFIMTAVALLTLSSSEALAQAAGVGGGGSQWFATQADQIYGFVTGYLKPLVLLFGLVIGFLVMINRAMVAFYLGVAVFAGASIMFAAKTISGWM